MNNNWQPISTIPKDGRMILVIYKGGNWIYPEDPVKVCYRVVYHSAPGGDDPSPYVFHEFGLGSFREADLSHWMELPEPPEATE